jgi:hypothetical protein
VILEHNRSANMWPRRLVCPLIAHKDFLDIVESGARIALLMPKTVGGHLIEARAALRSRTGAE